MITNPSFRFTCLSLLILTTFGCASSSIDQRISENLALYESLDPERQHYIMDGIVFPGDSTELAYMALGKPSSIETKQRGDITVEMWTYKKYYPSGTFEDFLTAYSTARNPNLLRPLTIDIGQMLVADSLGNLQGPNTMRGKMGNATQTSGTMDPVSLPDLPVYYLYVFLYKDKVTDVQIDSLDGTVFEWSVDEESEDGIDE